VRDDDFFVFESLVLDRVEQVLHRFALAPGRRRRHRSLRGLLQHLIGQPRGDLDQVGGAVGMTRLDGGVGGAPKPHDGVGIVRSLPLDSSGLQRPGDVVVIVRQRLRDARRR
jgi:hypothetical protein